MSMIKASDITAASFVALSVISVVPFGAGAQSKCLP
jgi:hypothetical protein